MSDSGSEVLMSSYELARLALARFDLDEASSLRATLERALRVSAATLGVDCASVWLLETRPDGEVLRCIASHRGPRLAALAVEDHPRYLTAIAQRRVVAVTDAVTDPRTSELAETYLKPLGIVSLIDAPLFRNGALVGVVCHEHAGAPKSFSSRDRDFASSVADLVATLLELHDRRAVEDQLRATEQQLFEARKMEALGRLAAGVAHDFANVLTSISLQVGILAHTTGAAERAEIAREVEVGVAHGKRLVNQLLAFGRKQPNRPTELELGRVLRELEPTLLGLLGPKLTLKLELDEAPLRVMMDRSQLEQVVLNLVVNARDASERGTITLAAHASSDAQLELTVADEGSGMDETTLRCLFEPFYTTKPADRGTGLGLAIVHGIVYQSGGSVRVESELGRGSRFVITLPRVRG